MAQYILIYKSNQAFDWSQLPKEEVAKVIDAWNSWSAMMGSAVKGSGAFKFGGKSVTKNGEKEADNLLTGFAIIEARDFSEAAGFAKQAPSVVAEQGSIEIYELFDAVKAA
ncbi:MAG TPA: YciI family protein [Candidatus Saccharimonadales bacterium]|nr:YciI family protein [Candidatus Saccharimonadales bacterium]